MADSSRPHARPTADGNAVSVVVPATSANLGCAFDCAGLALNLYLRASASISQSPNSGFKVLYEGPNADEIPRDDTNLIVKAMQAFALHAGANLPGARLDVHNSIPLGKGLGSSAAAIVAGISLAAELCRPQLVKPPGPKETLLLAIEMEGHGDNAAAAMFGGMTVVATTEATQSTKKFANVMVAKSEVSPDLNFVAVIPDVPLATSKSRAALPANYSRQDVVANLQRTALLTASFFSGNGPSPEMFRDRIHQPFRAPLVPGISECLEFTHPGLAGVFLSGAGSAVMGIAKHSAEEIGEAMIAEFRRKGVNADALLLKADNRGVQVSSWSDAGATGEG